MRPADLVIFLGRQFRDYQIAFLAENKCARAVLHDKRVAPAFGFSGGGRECFPNAFARLFLEAAKLSVAAWRINVTILDEWRGHDAVQTVRVLLANFFAFPNHL